MHLHYITSAVSDDNLVIYPNLNYLAEAATGFFYHDVFQKLMDVLTNAGKQGFET